ncbi:hypothetical protein F511_05320 [Dorcoceras hygrometricum]|uniref:Uncharacterized protein n=1 Tax=Dorcoceras hygrometricum TaxID=472368 RepID=A0A2Z7D2E8_9LAMI|nr:hypothetical protein F511_05320 [Dorcoceras hygrometricum]
MLPRRGRGRTARRSTEESWASESDEDVQQNIPLRRRERHAEIAVDNRQSGPRPEPRLLRQDALEALTRSARMDSPRRTAGNKFPAKIGGGGAWAAARRRELREGGGGFVLGLGQVV